MSTSIGIFGAGFVARQHAGALSRVGARIAAVCDLVHERAEELAREHEGCAIADTTESLLARDDVDAVIVAVPNAAHKQLAIDALRAGKDILLEKPMALNAAECDEILAAHRQGDRMLQLGFVCRCTEAATAVRDLVGSGQLGTVHHAKASIYRQRGIPGLGRWFTTRSRSGGGVLIDLGVHLIDLVMHVTGQRRVERASAWCAGLFGDPPSNYVFEGEMWAGPPDLAGTFDVEDSATGLLRFADGLTLELNAYWASNMPGGLFPDGIVLLGDRGGLYCDVWGKSVRLVTEADGRVSEQDIPLRNGDAWNDAWTRQARSFCEAVRARTPPAASGEDGRGVQAVLDAMYRSSAERREVEVD